MKDLTCKHRGEKLRTEPGKTCQGPIEAPVFACALHGECTKKNFGVKRPNGASLQTCVRCFDKEAGGRERSEESPQPSTLNPQPPTKKLTLGMACYQRLTEVIFTLQALELMHPDIWRDVDLVVVDNAPESKEGKMLGEWMNAWKPGAQYIPFPEPVGTSAPRNHIFQVAKGEIVCVIDAHVMIQPGALKQIIDWFAAHPAFHGLAHGPLLGDHLQPMATHFRPEWNDQMYGVWDIDPRGLDPTAAAFPIPMSGLGLFACRRDDWPGFPSECRGFGAEEGMIHEWFKQRGAETLCLPFLRWWHWFGRPNGIPYPLTVENKFRNYLIWARHLRISPEPAIEHFSQYLPFPTLQHLVKEVAQLAIKENSQSEKLDESAAEGATLGSLAGAS